jgi:hypothetical protein
MRGARLTTRLGGWSMIVLLRFVTVLSVWAFLMRLRLRLRPMSLSRVAVSRPSHRLRSAGTD